MSLGSQVKKYRTSAGCTYAEIEAMSGVSTGSINALEKRNSKRSEYAQDLARAFGLTTDQLLDEAADHTEHIPAHIASWRITKAPPTGELTAKEPAATWTAAYWPFSIDQNRFKTALNQDDVKLIEAYILALVQTRESHQGKQERLHGNGRP
jgi:transcriptional regulator with XRE-family HTH domain